MTTHHERERALVRAMNKTRERWWPCAPGANAYIDELERAGWTLERIPRPGMVVYGDKVVLVQPDKPAMVADMPEIGQVAQFRPLEVEPAAQATVPVRRKVYGYDPFEGDTRRPTHQCPPHRWDGWICTECGATRETTDE